MSSYVVELLMKWVGTICRRARRYLAIPRRIRVSISEFEEAFHY